MLTRRSILIAFVIGTTFMLCLLVFVVSLLLRSASRQFVAYLEPQQITYVRSPASGLARFRSALLPLDVSMGDTLVLIDELDTRLAVSQALADSTDATDECYYLARQISNLRLFHDHTCREYANRLTLAQLQHEQIVQSLRADYAFAPAESTSDAVVPNLLALPAFQISAEKLALANTELSRVQADTLHLPPLARSLRSARLRLVSSSARLNTYRALFARCTVTSPGSGTLLFFDTAMSDGAHVSEGDLLCAVTNYDSWQARAYVGDLIRSQLTEGQACDIAIPLAGQRDAAHIAGTISSLSRNPAAPYATSVADKYTPHYQVVIAISTHDIAAVFPKTPPPYGLPITVSINSLPERLSSLLRITRP